MSIVITTIITSTILLLVLAVLLIAWLAVALKEERDNNGHCNVTLRNMVDKLTLAQTEATKLRKKCDELTKQRDMLLADLMAYQRDDYTV